jgi:hypothetical protein
MSIVYSQLTPKRIFENFLTYQSKNYYFFKSNFLKYASPFPIGLCTQLIICYRKPLPPETRPPVTPLFHYPPTHPPIDFSSTSHSSIMSCYQQKFQAAEVCFIHTYNMRCICACSFCLLTLLFYPNTCPAQTSYHLNVAVHY